MVFQAAALTGSPKIAAASGFWVAASNPPRHLGDRCKYSVKLCAVDVKGSQLSRVSPPFPAADGENRSINPLRVSPAIGRECGQTIHQSFELWGFGCGFGNDRAPIGVPHQDHIVFLSVDCPFSGCNVVRQ